MDDARRPRFGGEEAIEFRHPIGVGGRDVEPATGVVQSAGTDPADAGLDGVKNREEIVPGGDCGFRA
jgi:hypothetical protein